MMKKNHTEPKQYPQFNTEQKRSLSERDSVAVLKSFVKNPAGRLLTIQNGFLIIVPAWMHGFYGIDIEHLYITIRFAYSKEFAHKICSGIGYREEFEEVIQWLLWADADRRQTEEIRKKRRPE